MEPHGQGRGPFLNDTLLRQMAFAFGFAGFIRPF